GLGISRGDYAAVERHAHEGRALWHALGNASQEAFCLFLLGFATTRLGKYTDARAYLEAGLEVSRAARHGGAEANCLFTLAELASGLGDNDEARGGAEAALSRATEIGQARSDSRRSRIPGCREHTAGGLLGRLGLSRSQPGDPARAGRTLVGRRGIDAPWAPC